MLDPLWKCADGRVMKIGAMQTSHVQNCIAKIERSKRGWRVEFLERLRLELVIRSLKR